MLGHFDIQMLHSPGLTPELVAAVRREGGDSAIEEYMKRLSVDDVWRTDNLVLQTTPSHLFYQAMSATSHYGTWSGGGIALLGFIQLATTSTEPSYAGDIYNAAIAWSNLPDTPSGIVTGSACKLFVDDCIVTPEIKSDAGGREAIYGKFRWLYLPGQCTSDQIRSITVYLISSYTIPDSAYNKTRAARVRIKDGGGNPVTLNKLATKSLLVEYTFTMPSL